MEAVIFIGIQATGKSSFFKEKLFNSHIRISLDVLNTRNNEQKFLDVCFATQKSFVIDNTNPTKKDRERYIEQAQNHNYEITGYYFQSELNEALHKNKHRNDKEIIPESGVKATYGKLEKPSFEEGFDQLFYVKIENNRFVVFRWKE